MSGSLAQLVLNYLYKVEQLQEARERELLQNGLEPDSQ